MTTAAQRLRQKLLDLAIRGKLVPQDPKDEPAEKLLARIRRERNSDSSEATLTLRHSRKTRNVSGASDKSEFQHDAGEINSDSSEATLTLRHLKKTRNVSEASDKSEFKISDDEKPFAIPPNWTWCRLGEIFSLQAGKNISAKELIATPSQGLYPCYGGNGIRGYLPYFSNEGIHAIVGRQGALCGNMKLSAEKFYATEHAVVVETFCGMLPHFAYYFLTQLNLNQYATATAQPGLSVKEICKVVCPLPPLAEQKRIVAALEGMLKAADAVATGMEKIAALKDKARAKILDLAIRGKLVKQDAEDEPAEKLLARIRRERNSDSSEAALTLRHSKKTRNVSGASDQSGFQIGAGEINSDSSEASLTLRHSKKTRNVSGASDKSEFQIPDDEKPFDIPQSWAWCRLGEITESFSAKPYQILESKIAKVGTFPVVSQGQKFIDGYFNDETKVCGCVVGADPRAARNHDETADHNCGAAGVRALPVIVFGDHTRNVKYIDFPFVVGADGTKLFRSFVDPKWTFYWVLYAATIEMESRGYGRHWNVLCGLPIPLPPLAEQKRIVAKVDEMLAACDALTPGEMNSDSSEATLTLRQSRKTRNVSGASAKSEFQHDVGESNSDSSEASLTLRQSRKTRNVSGASAKSEFQKGDQP